MADLNVKNPSITTGDFGFSSGGVVTSISGFPVGGTGGTIIGTTYRGDGSTIDVNNNTRVITIHELTQQKIDSIPHKVSDLTDSANYQPVSAMTAYYTTAQADEKFVTQTEYGTYKNEVNRKFNNKQDKLTFGYNSNGEISGIGDENTITALAGSDYSAGIDLKIENNIISVDTNGNPNNTASNTRNFVEGSWTVASGYMNHAEGVATSALGYGVHAQGMWTKFSSNDGQLQGAGTGPIYWGAGAAATVEGYCNATTSCPMSGTEGQDGYGPIHGGVLKVIGNGYRQHRLETESATYYPSDALIIFKDGTISAFGDIYNNGKKYITNDALEGLATETLLETTSGELENWVNANYQTQDDMSAYYKKTDTSSKQEISAAIKNFITTDDLTAYNVTGQQGVKITTAHDNKITTFGVEITTTPVVADTTLSGYNGIAASLDGNTSAQWNVGLTQDMLNTINGKQNQLTQTQLDNIADIPNKLDSTVASQTYQQKGNYLSANALNGYATEQYVQDASAEVTAWVGQQGYLTAIPSEYITETELADYNYVTTATTNSLSSEIEEISSTLNDKYTLSAGAGIYFYEDSINKTTRIDCTVTAATTVAQLTDSGNYYKKSETSGATELSTEFSKYIQTISTGVGLSGDGKTTQLGIDTTASINLTNASAKSSVSAESATNALSSRYAKQLQDASKTIQISDVTALQNWASSNSSTWNEVSAKLTTAQYATDSATFVTSSNASISAAGEQYALTTTGWAKVQAGSTFTGVTTDVTLTGDGTDNSHKLGVAWSALSSNKIDSAKSANSAEYITNGVGYSGFDDISSKFDSLTSYVPYSATVLPIGTNNTATNNSIAIGANNKANDLGFAVGQSNTALKRSLAFGVNNYANDISLAIGYGNSASGNNDNNQSAVNIAIGYANSAADHAAALINVCTAENYAFAAGHANSAIDNSVAFGRNTSAYFYSFDFGHSNDVRYYSYAFGRGLHYEGQWANASQYGAFVIGGWNATTSYATTADAPLFIIGNGSNNNPSDGFIVYRDGDVTAAGKISANGMFAVSTDATLFGQSRIANVGDTTALGTNWMGVTNDGQGFLKSISGNNVGSLNGTSIQINYKPNQYVYH